MITQDERESSRCMAPSPAPGGVSPRVFEPEKAREPHCSDIHVALLTAGRDKPYALGLASALIARGIRLDFIGSDEVDGPELHNTPLVRFLNLRGDQRENAPLLNKIVRVLAYYSRLVRYVAAASPPVLHILWNNKFELFDRTVLMLFYRLLGKKIVLTAHNVNAGERDSKDDWINRRSLAIQYGLAHHIFVHTEKMKHQLMTAFGVKPANVTVIPFGINNTLPISSLTSRAAKERLGIPGGDKTLLFFGNIAPYKGLEYLVAAVIDLLRKSNDYRLIIAGRPKGPAEYWEQIQRTIAEAGIGARVISRTEFIPDEEVEIYFKGADVLVLPYVHIFQSGVLFLGYSFGLPVIAADVGSLKEEVLEGRTGCICRPRDSIDLAERIKMYFSSDLYGELDRRRQEVRDFANERYSWTKVGELTKGVYAGWLAPKNPTISSTALAPG